MRAGDEITPHYDPMIAKLIVYGPDRASALRQLSRALGETRVAGTVTNLGFLKRLADHAGFAAGQVDTGLIARDLESLTQPDEAKRIWAERAAALGALGLPVTRNTDPWVALSGFRVWGAAEQTVELMQGDTPLNVRVTIKSPTTFDIDGVQVEATERDGTLKLSDGCGGVSLGLFVDAESVTIFDDGTVTRFDRVDPMDRADAAIAGGDVVRAPMPGLVTQVRVAPGDPVEASTPLLTLEAMKMEHTLRAPRDGVVAEVLVATGSQVENGAVLVQLEATDE